VRYGGGAYVGDDAWNHIEAKAGYVMGRFVEKYVRTPIREVEGAHSVLQPISLHQDEDTIFIQIGATSLSIARSPIQIAEEALDDLEGK
jgi:hypothetical protein